jgi:hypothetical protein
MGMEETPEWGEARLVKKEERVLKERYTRKRAIGRQ